MSRRRRSVCDILLLSALLLTACAGPLKQIGSETSFTSKSSSFDPFSLQHEQVAVLNAVVGFGLEGYSQQVSRSLSVAVKESYPSMKMIPAHETLSRINRDGLAEDYAAMVSNYMASGILDRDMLRKIGQATGARYVFQPGLAAFSQSMSGRFSAFGLRIVQTRVSVLRLSVQLWDTQTGEIVWEASGEATLAGEDVREVRIPFEEIADNLWQRMLKGLLP
ncbi:MAG TPA: hypothetical protein VEI24_02340 [Nitrospiria bacterium]|nr:hypothetical protein [Nitrospiria bacterium]